MSPLDAYVAAIDNPEVLTRALIRTKSRAGREVLARIATGGRGDAAQLEAAGRAYRTGSAPIPPADPARAMDYARVLAVQTDHQADRAAALGLLQWVADRHGRLLTEREGALLVQLALKERDRSVAEAALRSRPVARGAAGLAAADVANPWLWSQDGDHSRAAEDRWLEALNAGLFGPDAVRAGLLPSGDTPFDRLTTTSTKRLAHERKITVVISCFNPDHHLLTAVRSVIEQTWQNFELFVVDDASPAPTPGVLEQVERMDPRVTVIRKAVNGGTYRARNTALRIATGDFFTCLDSDDWAHPQRLELGVAPMIEDETLVATRSLGVRATEQMELSRVGYGGRFKAASSLMIRTFPVVNRLGFFDPVRKAADNEYALRVEASFDGRVLDVPTHALTVLLADAGSLSASDYSSGWRHPARSEYLESYSEWHRQVQWRDAPAFLHPHGPRSFPAPRRWERHPQDGPVGPELDAVVIADWRDGWLRPHTLDQLRALVDSGRRVAVVHHESLVEPTAQEHPLTRPLRELIQRGEVERVYLDDARHSALTVVADPRVLQFPPLLAPRLTSEQVALIVDPEAELARQYAPADVERHARELLGADSRWLLGEWPPVPDAPEPVRVGAGSGTVYLASSDPRSDGDLEVDTWLLREPADGERGTRLDVVRQAGTVAPQTRALSDAWATSPDSWQAAATRWLTQHPNVWALAIRPGPQRHLTQLPSVNHAGPVQLVLAPGVYSEPLDEAAYRLSRATTP